MLNKLFFKISMIQLLAWKNVFLALRKIITLTAFTIRLLFLKLGLLLKVCVCAFHIICLTYLLAKWYVAGQGKRCLFQLDVVNFSPTSQKLKFLWAVHKN